MASPATTPPANRVPAGIIANIKVPATSANLGPGFDSAGIAFGLYDELEIRTTEAGFTAEIEGEGQNYLPTDARHLIIAQIRLRLEHLGWHLPGLKLKAINRIPHSRGLGSSAAAHMAAAMAVKALLPQDAAITDDNLLQWASEAEGHPDNVAPAVYGGLTFSWKQDDASGDIYRAIRMDPHTDITPVVAIPAKPLSTAAARTLLPATVPYTEAVANAARAALLAPAMTRDPKLLFAATEDWLHQQYRQPSMPETLAHMTALRAQGHAAVVSGAGPTLCVFAADSYETDVVVQQLEQRAAKSSQHWDVRILPVDTEGATMEIFRP
ncbi:MAG: homoserine kinase [Yaniella sp.]|uniref:homoserine kinase n=1 Tax=Yaniella sp. TaxID=2773929 RepID=UPI002647937B|nr:homoserine kinase [Yaniella sp.]MDN5731345.1 homoserine kinase [Yaniella sp.]MDN5815487.1 homoserine kinase [Yaniella sp.]MDN5889743.1 homoserine kinase [Yaniella sp.]MDN5911244.1 homoserine kinase [Yaniella sp.]MDN6457640.1 homoserine kinase [Yaniella sp.]